MSPFKLSLIGSNDDPDESFELDDELVGKLQARPSTPTPT